jgi:phosphatidylserine/phosphatidylglycerophosphate/cardiolipin synthase-like enzyme
MGMTITDSNAIADACCNLVGQVAAHPSLADSIVSALSSGKLTATSGPVGISNVLKGAPGSHYLKEFLKAWNSSAPHLGALDVCAMVRSALVCYSLAQGRAHTVDTVWTGPEVAGSEVRRTEAVVHEMLVSAENELLIVGYWLVTSAAQIKALIEILIQKSRTGIQVRFVFDPGEKLFGPDNFTALNTSWPRDLKGAPREIYSWSQHMTKLTNSNGHLYNRKLHAKVIVADRRDALVTSANLTHAGILENLEMGFRVQGAAASAVVRHFDLLIAEGILERRL